jgi:hypothetical protein
MQQRSNRARPAEAEVASSSIKAGIQQAVRRVLPGSQRGASNRSLVRKAERIRLELSRNRSVESLNQQSGHIEAHSTSCVLRNKSPRCQVISSIRDLPIKKNKPFAQGGRWLTKRCHALECMIWTGTGALRRDPSGHTGVTRKRKKLCNRSH